MDRAIMVLKQQSYDRKQAEALLQKMSVKEKGMSRVLGAFLEMSAALEKRQTPYGAPEVAAYEFQSGGVVDMLKKLKSKFAKELDEVETGEANRAHAYDLEMLHLSNSIEAAKRDREEKAELKASRAAAKAEWEGTLADTKADLADDEKFLADMQATFTSKSADYEANQKIRAEELEALSTAVEIISGKAVSGHAETYLPSAALAQRHSKSFVSFAQLRSTEKTATKLVREAAVNLLSRKAKVL